MLSGLFQRLCLHLYFIAQHWALDIQAIQTCFWEINWLSFYLSLWCKEKSNLLYYLYIWICKWIASFFSEKIDPSLALFFEAALLWVCAISAEYSSIENTGNTKRGNIWKKLFMNRWCQYFLVEEDYHSSISRWRNRSSKRVAAADFLVQFFTQIQK